MPVCVCVPAYVSCPDFMFSLSFGNYDLNGSPACGVSFCVSLSCLPSFPPLLSLPLPLCVSAVWQLRVTRHCSLHFQFATLSHIIAMSADARVESPLNASLFQFTFNIYAHFSNTHTHIHAHTVINSHTHWEAAVIYACV